MSKSSPRIGGPHGIRVLDTVVALVVLWIVFFLLQWKRGKLHPGVAIATSLGLSLLVLFPLAIAVHGILGITTSLNCKLRLASYDKCVAKGFLSK